MKTNVHYPTDANLLSDACRKIIEFATTLASGHKQLQWRQNKFLLAQHKKRYHKVRNLKHSTSTSKSQRAARQEGRRTGLYQIPELQFENHQKGSNYAVFT